MSVCAGHPLARLGFQPAMIEIRELLNKLDVAVAVRQQVEWSLAKCDVQIREAHVEVANLKGVVGFPRIQSLSDVVTEAIQALFEPLVNAIPPVPGVVFDTRFDLITDCLLRVAEYWWSTLVADVDYEDEQGRLFDASGLVVARTKALAAAETSSAPWYPPNRMQKIFTERAPAVKAEASRRYRATFQGVGAGPPAPVAEDPSQGGSISEAAGPAATKEERAAARQQFVQPLLGQKGWSSYEWAQQARVEPPTAKRYLDGTTVHVRRKQRTLLARALGLKTAEDLPE